MWILPSTLCPYVPESERSISESSVCFLFERSVTWRGKPSASKSWLTRWKKVSWIPHLFGRILPPLTANLGVTLWIASLLDFPVNHSPSLGSEEDPRMKDGCGRTSIGSSEKSGPPSSFLRMSQGYELEDYNASSKTLPRSGSMWSGYVYERATSERRTEETEYSCWPTPTAVTYGSNHGGAAGRTGPIRKSLTGLLTENKSNTNGSPLELNPDWVETLMGMPVGWTDLER